MSNVKFEYIGNFRINGLSYEVIDDETNGLVNIFFKNTESNDVECWSFDKEDICKNNSNLILVKNYWIKCMKQDFKKDKIFLQTFPIDFWNVILDIKSGNSKNVVISMINKGENE